ncbi:MAG: transporter [Verrucomicrobiales bacterium]|nr:transporter [Verrucomicrobiales bacterium]
MSRGRSWWLSSVVLSAVAAETGAAQPAWGAAPDKSGYTLFNPVPQELLRELSPDRPDKTESPYTVDAGHFQMEMDFANFTYNQTDGTTTRAWIVAPFNLKAGLLNNVDFQLAFGGYMHANTHVAGGSTTQSGIGDLTTRLKINLWGDDGGRAAFALLPFVTFPTSTDNLGTQAVEGGIIFPLAVKLPRNFNLGLETAVGFLREDNVSNYHGDFINSFTVSHDLIGRLAGFVELFSDISTDPHSGWVGTVDAGLTYLVTDNVQLDGGCNFGVTHAADDFNPFAGITVRF